MYDKMPVTNVKRLQSVNSISTHMFAHHLNHKELDDAIRHALHRLLGSCRLGSFSCVHAVVIALMSNLQKYPEDKLSVWR